MLTIKLTATKTSNCDNCMFNKKGTDNCYKPENIETSCIKKGKYYRFILKPKRF